MLMPKRLIATLAAGAALAATGCAPDGTAASSAPAAAMPPGQRMMVAEVGQRTVRMVQINDNGRTVDLIYDMAPGQPQSPRVLRLENVNGVLQVIYDNSVHPWRWVRAAHRASCSRAAGCTKCNTARRPRRPAAADRPRRLPDQVDPFG